MKISGKIVSLSENRIISGVLHIEDGRINKISQENDVDNVFILPGLIDAHIHIESSMISPSAFAVEAVKHGTVATVSDPHEIANVCGLDGVEFMIKDGNEVPFKFYFGAPSCVPATDFETSGARIGVNEIKYLLEREEIKYLSEMMNFPGVINNDEEILEKIEIAKQKKKPVDGHAPGLSGNDLEKYVNTGISTDHECISEEEAVEKIQMGMKILIREGSAARNLENLKGLFSKYHDKVMLCSDDLHPEMLMKGHINLLVRRLLEDGYDMFDVLRSVTVNPVMHYGLNVGLLREGDPADLIIVGEIDKMDVKETWIDGKKVFDNGTTTFISSIGAGINFFNASPVSISDITVHKEGREFRVIKAIEGELVTRELIVAADENTEVITDTEKDILKIVVKDRYEDGPVQTGFINGFNLKSGAFASSVAHDSHNIICIGTNDKDIIDAVNEVIRMKGGLAVCDNGNINSLQLEIAGIMTADSCSNTATKYEELNKTVSGMGCTMKAPFMTLAFMALLVIPELKIGDKGLFDVRKFQPVSLFC
jgi:adenine deaminase